MAAKAPSANIDRVRVLEASCCARFVAHHARRFMKVIVTAGPTREFLDPVRFLSNPSTGRMGFACASEGVDRGHDVVLISGPVSLPTPDGLRRVDVVSASDMWDAVRLAFGDCDVLIMCAAVADWTVDVPAERKLKKCSIEHV